MKDTGKNQKKIVLTKKFFRFVKKEKTDVRDVEYIGENVADKKLCRVCCLNVILQRPGSYELYAALEKLDIPNGEYILVFNSTKDGHYFGVSVMERTNKNEAKAKTRSVKAAVAV